MKPLRPTLWVSWLLLAVLLAVAAGLYPELPPRIATHWNCAGEADGYGSRLQAVLWPLGLLAGLMTLQQLMPRWADARFKNAALHRVWTLVMQTVQCVVAGLSLATWLHGVDTRVSVPAVAGLGLGVICVVVGNYLGKLPRNHWIGIRTPWTLASDEVWARCHRQGGRLMMLAGLACLLLTALGMAPRWLLLPPLAMAGWSCGYSWWLARDLGQD